MATTTTTTKKNWLLSSGLVFAETANTHTHYKIEGLAGKHTPSPLTHSLGTKITGVKKSGGGGAEVKCQTGGAAAA